MSATVGIGQGRKTESLWVQNYQDPFHKRVAAIVDPLGEKRSAGTLTYDEVTKAQSRLEEEIAGLQKDATSFAGLSGTHKTVVDKAQQTLDPIIQSWRDTFTKDLAGLPKPPDAPAGPSPEAPDRQTILGAAAPQKRQALPPSTILGGAAMKSNLRPAKTLLGY